MVPWFLASEKNDMVGRSCGREELTFESGMSGRGEEGKRTGGEVGRVGRGGGGGEEEGEGITIPSCPPLVRLHILKFSEPPKIALPARDQNFKTMGDISESMCNTVGLIAFSQDCSISFLNLPVHPPGACWPALIEGRISSWLWRLREEAEHRQLFRLL